MTDEEDDQAILERRLLLILRAMMAPPGLATNIYLLALDIEGLVKKYRADDARRGRHPDTPAEEKKKALAALEVIKEYTPDGPIYQDALKLEELIKAW